MSTAARRTLRPDIESLRALAVLLVVVFHLWPDRLPGGFIGVDVFFVISGFLITTHMLRERERTGSISLSRFWARRVRRLFPAAVLVLLVSAIGVVVLWPTTRWMASIAEFWASLGLVQNWYLAANAVDYFAPESESPFQHYWSLSVEEQFYLAWPLLLLAVSTAVLRRRSGSLRTALVITTAAVLIVSLAYSIATAALTTEGSYFSTFSHAWEFAAGALLAQLWPSTGRPLAASTSATTRLAGLAVVTGILLIVASAVLLTGTSQFPGWIAIVPVTGTVLVIMCGPLAAQGSGGWLLSFAPLVWIGGISYSVYLWHWPLIVFAPDLLDRPLTTVDRLVILLLTLVLAWATKRWVEDPLRFGRAVPSTRRTYAMAAAISMLAVIATLMPFGVASSERAAAAESVASLIDDVTASGSPCVGAPALMAPPGTCDDIHRLDERIAAATPWLDQLDGGLRPPDDVWQTSWADCPTATSGTPEPCSYGTSDDAPRILIVGDSHAFQWAHAILPIAQKREWNVEISWMAGCSLHQPGRVWTGDIAINGSTACDPWRDAVLAEIAASREYDLIVTSSFARKFAANAVPETQAEIADAFAHALGTLSEGGAPVLVIAGSPLPDQHVPQCLERGDAAASPCATPRETALLPDPLLAAARSASTTGSISSLDITDSLCDESTCHSVVGGLPAYSDRHHLSRLFLLSLSPTIEQQIVDLVEGADD